MLKSQNPLSLTCRQVYLISQTFLQNGNKFLTVLISQKRIWKTKKLWRLSSKKPFFIKLRKQPSKTLNFSNKSIFKWLNRKIHQLSHLLRRLTLKRISFQNKKRSMILTHYVHLRHLLHFLKIQKRTRWNHQNLQDLTWWQRYAITIWGWSQ